MNSILNYNNMDSYNFTTFLCNRDGILNSPLTNWLYFGKLPENVTVTPSYNTQTIHPSMKNRYISSVVIDRVPIVTGTLNLPGDTASAIFEFAGAKSATSSNPAYATVTVVDGVVTITAVAAGQTVVNVYDVHSDLIATFTVAIA